MPVILPAGAEGPWLDPELPVEVAVSLLRPYPAELMRAAPASRRVSDVRNDEPGVLLADALAA
jgi:putative SOS response-associated peptidase YedK